MSYDTHQHRSWKERNLHDNQHVTLLKPFRGFVTNAKKVHTNIRVLPLAFGSCCSIEGALRLNVMVVYIMFYWEGHNEDIENPSLSSMVSMLDQDCHSGSWPCPQMPHLEKFHANHPWIQQS